MWKFQFQKTCQILFELKHWWIHSWISQHQISSFHQTVPVKNSGWKDEHSCSYVKTRCHFGHLTDEKSVWINNRGSNANYLWWKMCFHNHLWFPPGLQEPCWGEHEVQHELGRIGSLMKICRWWSLDRKEADVRGRRLKTKCGLRNYCLLLKVKNFWKSLAVEILKKQKWKVSFLNKNFSRSKLQISTGEKCSVILLKIFLQKFNVR